MSTQSDFEKLVADMDNAETVNEAVNTMLLGLSAMLDNDAKAAKSPSLPFPATDAQLQSFMDTAVNIEAHLSEMLDIIVVKANAGYAALTDQYGNVVPSDLPSVAERLAAGEPRSAAHAAVQGSRGAEVLPPPVTPYSDATPVPVVEEVSPLPEPMPVVNPAEIKENG